MGFFFLFSNLQAMMSENERLLPTYFYSIFLPLFRLFGKICMPARMQGSRIFYLNVLRLHISYTYLPFFSPSCSKIVLNFILTCQQANKYDRENVIQSKKAEVVFRNTFSLVSLRRCFVAARHFTNLFGSKITASFAFGVQITAL